MTIVPAALEIIKRNEGLRLTAYQDVVGVWTIGYGHTGPDVREGLTITAAGAEQLLANRLANEFEPGVRAAIGDVPTTDNEFGAMVSLAYNIGVGAFKGSTVARMHKAGSHAAAASAFSLWDKAGGGKVLAGLVRRRQEEADLYLRRDPAQPVPPPLIGHGPLSLGDRSDAAAELQRRLIAKGYDVGPAGADGVYGNDTDNALWQWATERDDFWTWVWTELAK